MQVGKHTIKNPNCVYMQLLEIGNVPVNRGLWMCRPCIHDGVLVNGIDHSIP